MPDIERDEVIVREMFGVGVAGGVNVPVRVALSPDFVTVMSSVTCAVAVTVTSWVRDGVGGGVMVGVLEAEGVKRVRVTLRERWALCVADDVGQTLKVASDLVLVVVIERERL